MTLDPKVAFLLEQFSLLQETPLHKLSPREARKKFSFAYKMFEGMIHGFIYLTCFLDQAQETVDLVANELKKVFGKAHV